MDLKGSCPSSASLLQGRLPSLLLLAVVFLLPGAGTGKDGNGPGRADVRDWKAHPAIVEIDTKHDVYAVGDVHGDYDRLVTLLSAAKIIAADPPTPERVQWSAGKAVLVCTGDLIDKWHQGMQVIALFRALQQGAERAGGRVVVLMGNHEAEFIASQGVGEKFVKFVLELKARKLDPATVAAGRDQPGIGAWMRGLPFAARINDWFFAHAGNTHGRSIKELRSDLQSGIDRKGFRARVLRDPDSLLEARLQPRPWWEQKGDTASKARERLAKRVEALGVKHLAIGHQPSKVYFAGGATRKAGQLVQHFDGLIFFLDVGMSRGVGDSTGALLRIRPGKGGRADRITSNGNTRKLWP
jgi:hypothetical protein